MNVREILDAVCAHHGLETESVLAGAHTTLPVVARTQTIVLAREFTCASIADVCDGVGLAAGNSLVHDRRRHVARMADPASPYARSFNAIHNELKTRV